MTQLSLGVNTQNQITNSGFSYDASGNLLGDGSFTYTYDAESRISTLNGTGAAYFYDSDGQRVRKQVGNDTTEYVSFNGQPIAERKASGVWNDYIYSGSRRLVSANGNTETSASNGSFEQGSNNWVLWGSSATVVTNAANAHSGNNYLQISVASGGGAGANNQTVAVQTGDQITFGGWVNLQSGGGGSPGWCLVVLDSSQTAIAYICTPSPTSSGWMYQTATYTVPAGAAYVRLYAQIYQPSVATTIWVDDGFLSTGTAYYHGDHLGSARALTDTGGNVMWTATFLPFGQEWNPQITVNHYKFTGKERDSESGLDNFGARYNSSQYGRFMSPDPTRLSAFFDDPQTWNMYIYAHNNPLAYVDRNGKWPTPTHVRIDTAALGQALTPDQMRLVESVSAGQDNPFLGGQFNGVAYEHAMRGPGQTVEQAEALYNGFVSGQVQAAQEAQIKFWMANPGSHSLSDEALVHFAMALHAVDDSTSPAHAGFQYWNWINPFLVRRHTRAESSITPQQLQTAVSAAQGLFDQTFGMFGFDEFDLLELQQQQGQQQQQQQQEQVTSRICSGLDENGNCTP
jgi:RHS repeat-associated protein